ncbi:MAG: tRNA-dihydrouridine synthase, partial [Pseudomonadota bacterium]
MQLDQHAKLSVAPMMDWTDRHCRYLHRQLS